MAAPRELLRRSLRWVCPVIRFLRKGFPDGGRPYELFNVAVLMAFVAMGGIVVNPVEKTLINTAAEVGFGLAMTFTAITSALLAYSRRDSMITLGYNILVGAVVLVSGFYLFSLIFIEIDFAGIVRSVLYGFLARYIINLDGINPGTTRTWKTGKENRGQS